MFAGPNGSGKSTVLAEVERTLGRALLGVVVNADEIEREIRETGALDLIPFLVTIAEEEVRALFAASEWLRAKGHASAAEAVRVEGDRLWFEDYPVDSYLAAVVADHIRQRLVAEGVSFTFETVMSSPAKVDFLANAQEEGYRTYLYFIATEDPVINVSRVENRVNMGGHPVAEEAIVSRYHRSIGLLLGAMHHATRAYVFDNSTSGASAVLLAEVLDTGEVVIKADRVPHWFDSAVLSGLSPEE